MMIIRKLVKAGPSSHTVSLPKEWLAKNGLQAGDSIYVTEKSDQALLLTVEAGTVPVTHKETTITLDGKEIGTLQRELSAAYVNNSRVITLVGENAASRLPAIRSILQGFVALEITEQTARGITIKDLLDLNEISLEKTLRRVDMMVRTMLEECGAPDIEDRLRVKDEEINKLYFLLCHLLKSALITPGMGERFGLTHAGVLGYWSLVINLENLADCVKNAHTALGSVGKEKVKQVRDVVHSLKADLEDAMKAWYQKDKSLADSVLRNRDAIMKKCQAVITRGAEPALVEAIEQCKASASIISNLARVVIDSE